MKQQKSKRLRKRKRPQFVGLPKYPPTDKKYYLTQTKQEIPQEENND